MENKTSTNIIIFALLLSLQTVLIFLNTPFSIGLEVLIKLTLLYVACWYVFKIPAIAMFVGSKKTIGQIVILYSGILVILVSTHDEGDSWREVIYVSLLLVLLIITVFFLAYQRLNTYKNR